MSEPGESWVDLYWLPLGAGGHVVRASGWAYERLAALRARRTAMDLYHCGLMVHADHVTYAVEMGPVWSVSGPDRGVICEGPVGARLLGRLRVFRYEVRCWPGGRIPDVDEAVESPVRTTTDPARVEKVLAALHDVPTLTWGRDELGAGDMWNSNSMVAFALARSGHDLDFLHPPAGGRAPGWHAGSWLAARSAGGG